MPIEGPNEFAAEPLVAKETAQGTREEEKETQYFETVIIGTGFSGLLAALRLQKKGFNDFLLLERSPELGGTWQINSYPGAEVDIPTSLYSISFVPFPFRKTFAPQSELLAYTNHIIEKFGLRKKAKTNCTVSSLTFDESVCIWHVETESGDRYSARFVIDTSGVLANPHTPKIDGAESFKGAQFHAGHWDHSVTYKGKRVAVIGSGCSGAQIVPAMAENVGRLTLFMGKAQWILPRSDRDYSALEAYIRTLPGIRHLIRLFVFIFYDIRFVAFRRYPLISRLAPYMKAHYRRRLEKHLDKYIKDEKLRQHMMPDYELGSRRVIPTNSYLPALARDNVDVDISGIDCITPAGIRTKDGKEIDLDIIVYATGYYAYSDMKRALTFQVNGKGGRNLNSEWETEIASYKGITVSGYPNYFKVNGPNTGSGHSSQMSYMQVATDYIVQAISAVKQDASIKAIEPKQDLQDQYVAGMRAKMQKTVWQNATTTAFYRKNMSEEVTSLSPEPVTGFIFSRKWFRLSDYHLLK
ncbi:putative flavoprotein CzcO associated with the cation diffusion facilitator CzcD [Mariprofundus aestuarium]|uniref:Putative flavoprotein CzcO associated with the cation diffusion facilitator CzcD n=1 Tax=Mariprofundus aestuarium TaxID=1921086 RepID=A0A2K8KXE8_MARES|nr:NAD(P)/FAD-dependent oxidoreductase [Mariprofundus aestuarium]ATX79615.1 putative flavoprotein CzcO associated with the cation diffusion facilitator CzcD [Mariprofundus aestuarium]